MKKILFILSLFLTLTLSGQIRSGVVASTGITAAGGDPPANMITNGTFDSGAGWTVNTPPWTIGSGVASYDNSGNNAISQASADMVSAILPNTSYTITFDIVSAGAAWITFLSTNYVVYINGAGYTTGSRSVNFTTPASIGDGGLQIYANNDIAFTIDNISLNAQ